MINKEKNDKEQPSRPKDDGLIDIARMDVQCHILIKDKDTGEVLVNKRG
jgi:hypothetical protein